MISRDPNDPQLWGAVQSLMTESPHNKFIMVGMDGQQPVAVELHAPDQRIIGYLDAAASRMRAHPGVRYHHVYAGLRLYWDHEARIYTPMRRGK